MNVRRLMAAAALWFIAWAVWPPSSRAQQISPLAPRMPSLRSAVQVDGHVFDGGRIVLDATDADLVDVLAFLGVLGRANVLADASVPHVKVSIHLRDITVDAAFSALASAYGLVLTQRDSVYLVSSSGRAATGLTETDTVPVTSTDALSEVARAVSAANPAVTVIAPSGFRVIVISGPVGAVSQARSMLNGLLAAGLATPAPTVAIPVNNLAASEALTQLKALGIVSRYSSVVADDPRGQLLVNGPAADVNRIEVALSSMTRDPLQVTYSVQVLDLEPTNDSSNIGALWNGVDSTGHVSTGSTYYGFTSKMIPVNVTINALIAQGSATVLARPKISVENRKTAKLLVGTTYPIVITNSGLVGGSQVQFVQIGVLLQLTPTLYANGTIHTDLQTTYSEIVGTEPVSQYPIIGTRTVSSTLNGIDGQSIVLAGLFSDVRSETLSRVPFLSNIPVFGEVFKNRAKSQTKDEIVFVLTPHIGVSAPTGNPIEDTSQ